MREIGLCHGKRVDNGEWVKGYVHTIDTCGYGYVGKAIQVQCGESRPFSVSVIPKTVGEFTGFHENLDGTGERLWEDDEVECKDAFGNKAIGVIKLIDGCWEVAFDKVTFGKGCREYLKCFIANYAIKRLGSIHDKEAV